MSARIFFICALTVCLAWCAPCPADEPAAPDFQKHVVPLLNKYCNGCHNPKEAEGELVLENFQRVMRGGEHGAVIVPGNADKSRMILAVEHKIEPFMPPEDEKAPSADEIKVLRAWINAGAKGPSGDAAGPLLPDVPKIAVQGSPRRPIHALAWSPDGRQLAVARYGTVEIVSGVGGKTVATLMGHTGSVNDVGFARDGSKVFAAAGEPGVVGELTLWNAADWSKLLVLTGHRDSIYTAALSPDGTKIATGSYDQKVILWDVATGKQLHELSGHNGAITSVAFHPTGKVLASASADRTVKLWDADAGSRLDTFNEPTFGQNSVAFSPDGRYVVAAGIDNRIRVWEIQALGREGTNPIVHSRFAHEAPILKLCFSPDGRFLVSSSQDKTVKIWESSTFTQLDALKGQSDWPTALAVPAGNKELAVGRLDGTLATFSLDALAGNIKQAEPMSSFSLPASAATAEQTPMAESQEAEPNDVAAAAQKLTLPTSVKGVFQPRPDQSADVDLYRFDAQAGQAWVVETRAAQDKSPADTRIEVLHADGRPVERMLLRAVRDSLITFRPINSTQGEVRVEQWEEMKLNQYMYLGGEVCKLFRAPRGPDSGWSFYTSKGNRQTYFDTSSTVHANGEPVYIVEPYLPGTQLVDNGLPVFRLNYENDDDGQRELGADSRLTLVAPATESYLVRVTDVRGFGGDDYKYTLTIRAPQPDFEAFIDGRDAKVNAGSGRKFTIRLDRKDEFDGDVRIDFSGMPPGFSVSTPLVVEAGHLEARGVINVDAGVPPSRTADDPVAAPKPGETIKPDPVIDWSTVKATASAVVNGRQVVKQLGNLGTITVGKAPGYTVILEPDRNQASPAGTPSAVGNGAESPEIVIAPGTTITAMLRINRNGFEGELKFDVENLPHGVIVDNIGLSGVLIRDKESERRIFLTTADWVPESTRLVAAAAQGEGGEVSRPIRLSVRRPKQLAQTGPPRKAP